MAMSAPIFVKPGSKSRLLLEEIDKLPLKDGVRLIPTYDPTASRGAKGWSGQISAKYGMSAAWVSATLAGWESSGHVELVREDKRIVGIRLRGDGEGDASPPPRSLRDQVHDLMRRHADDKGRVHVSTDDMRRELGVSPHDFIKAVWDLQKQGIVTFRQVGSGSSANLINYRLRNHRVNVVPYDDTANALTTKPWDICPDCHNTRRAHTRSNDNSGLICPAPKEGSPLYEKEKARDAEAAAMLEPEPVRPKPEPIKPQLSNYVECPDCSSTFTDETSMLMHRKAKHAPPPKPVLVPSMTSTKSSSIELDVRPRIEWRDYPLLTAVVKQYHARLAAITALQMAGEDGMAQTLVDKEGGLPKEQREVIALLTALGYES